MHKPKVTLIFIILAAIGCVAMLILSILTFTEGHVQQDDTVIFDATISKVHINDQNGQKTIDIYTEEYSNSWLIQQGVSEYVNVAGLKEGQHITVGVRKSWSDSVDNAYFVEVVSLQADDADYLTLQEYNQYLREDVLKAGLTAVFGFLVCLSVVLFLIVKRRK